MAEVHGQCDERHDHPGRGRPDHRDQVQQRDHQGQQQGVRDPPGDQPDERTATRDPRRDQVPEHEPADLGEHLVAQDDRPGPAAVRDHPVDQPADPGQVVEEVHGQHEDGQGLRGRGEDELPGTEQPAEHSGTPVLGQRRGEPVLEVVLLVEPADRGAAVLQQAQVVRQLVGEGRALADQWRDRGGEEAEHGQHHAERDDGDRRPAGQPPGQPPDRRVQPDREEQGEPHQDQHLTGRDQELDQGVRGGHPGGADQPDEVRRAPVDRPAGRPFGLGRVARCRPGGDVRRHADGLGVAGLHRLRFRLADRTAPLLLVCHPRRPSSRSARRTR